LRVVILKTTRDTLDAVVKHAKHAQHTSLNLPRGDIILISQTEDTLQPGHLPIQYRMQFERCYPDRDHESVRIWGKYWPYIVEGSNCRQLRRPFKMNDIRVTNKDYGRGGVRVYVDQQDVTVL
jgi:hypothetical protein